MLVLLGFYKKLPHLSTEEFRAHWDEHGRVVRAVAGYEKFVKRYVQHNLSPDPKSQTEMLYDGFSEVWFESEEKRDEFVSGGDFAPVLEHEAVFLDMDAKRWMVIDEPVVQVTENGG